VRVGNARRCAVWAAPAVRAARRLVRLRSPFPPVVSITNRASAGVGLPLLLLFITAGSGISLVCTFPCSRSGRSCGRLNGSVCGRFFAFCKLCLYWLVLDRFCWFTGFTTFCAVLVHPFVLTTVLWLLWFYPTSPHLLNYVAGWRSGWFFMCWFSCWTGGQQNSAATGWTTFWIACWLENRVLSMRTGSSLLLPYVLLLPTFYYISLCICPLAHALRAHLHFGFLPLLCWFWFMRISPYHNPLVLLGCAHVLSRCKRSPHKSCILCGAVMLPFTAASPTCCRAVTAAAYRFFALFAAVLVAAHGSHTSMPRQQDLGATGQPRRWAYRFVATGLLRHYRHHHSISKPSAGFCIRLFRFCASWYARRNFRHKFSGSLLFVR